ncbi:hypothetical protein ACH49M_21545 [Rhodococcus qingshengii]|uniref:hypothetical protein n=2 Tax=Rhodococcus TaxID=1827 RepID=UPI00370236DE
MNTIRIDFNDRARGGKVVALKSWADGPVTLGDDVIAFDETEDLRYSAVVAEEDEETGEIYLELGVELQSTGDNSAPSQQPLVTHPPITPRINPNLSWGQREVVAAFNRQMQQNSGLRRNIDDALRAALPAFTTVHHFQTRVPEGYLLRYKLDAMQDLRLQAARYFETVSKPEGSSAWDFLRREDLGKLSERVVVACLPDDTISSVLGQMEDDVAVAVAMPVENSEGIWTASTVSGITRQDDHETHDDLPSLTSVGLTFQSTIREFMEVSGALDALAKQEIDTGESIRKIAWGQVLLAA